MTLSATHPTLMDYAKRLDPQGKIDKIVELLDLDNEGLLRTMVWQEGNLDTGNRSTVRTGIPRPTWRKLYQGVQPTKSTTAQIVDSCGWMENYGQVDKALADLNGNTAEFLLSENMPILEGFRQELADTVFNGNEATESEAFTGLGPRYNSLAAPSGENIIVLDNAGGTEVYKSMYLVGWSPQTIFGIFPKGSKAGLQMNFLGEVTVENANSYTSGGTGGGGMFQAYRTHYRWDCGLCVRDWRFAVRIQYDSTELTKDSSGLDIVAAMADALELPPSLGTARFAFYCDREMKSYLRWQMADKVKNSTLTMEQVGGRPVMAFAGVPVYRTDALAVPDSALIT